MSTTSLSTSRLSQDPSAANEEQTDGTTLRKGRD